MSFCIPRSRPRHEPSLDCIQTSSFTLPPPITTPFTNNRDGGVIATGSNPRSTLKTFWTNLFEDVDADCWRAQGTQAEEPSPAAEDVEDAVKTQYDVNDFVDTVVVERDAEPIVSFAAARHNSQDSELGNPFASPRVHDAHTHQQQDGLLKQWELDHFTTTDRSMSRSFLLRLCNYCPFDLAHYLEQIFRPAFPDRNVEELFKRERFNQMKFLAFSGSCVVFLNWLLLVCLVPTRRLILADKIFYWGIAPWLVVPIPVMIYFNWPRKQQFFYQLFMSFALWGWSAYSLFLIQMCGYYKPADRIIDCGGKDFMNLLFYTSAFPVIGLFSLGQTRVMAIATAVLNATLMGSIIRYRTIWVRIFLLYILYTIFLVGAHFIWEGESRRVYRMREELKNKVHQAQRSRDREMRLEKSKQSLTSYIFHELRVPLNIANLARTNLLSEGGIHPDSMMDAEALENSLESMTQVLNDVLDFHRMESGNFRCVRRPYAFHRTLGASLQGLSLGAEEKGVSLRTELDLGIDALADREMALALMHAEDGYGGGGQVMSVGEIPDELKGIVIGDANRLRQIMNNLVSNAIKFTDPGGAIVVRTKSLGCCWPFVPDVSDSTPTSGDATNCEAKHLNEKTQITDTAVDLAPFLQDAANTSTAQCHKQMVIRIEVEDTGAGIQKKWMVDNRLFSPYVQTELGRLQGGKGTGLGLALIKNIVKFSGGRLGVQSQFTKGSTFWVELPVGIGPIRSTKLPPAASPTTSGRSISLQPEKVVLPWTDPVSPPAIPIPLEVDLPTDVTIEAQHESPKTCPTASPSKGKWSKRTKSALQAFDPPLEVLVVDDDSTTRNLMKRMLTRNGCIVSTSENGLTGLEMALGVPGHTESLRKSISPTSSREILGTVYPANNPQKYDIMFVDNQMPIMSGVDMVRKLRSLGRQDLLVGVTGNALKEDQVEYLQAGANGVVIKPVQESQLVEHLVRAAAERTRRLASLSAGM